MGDQFPEQLRRDYISRSMVPGQVLRIDWTFPDQTKMKRVLLVCTDPEPLVLMINSEPPEFQQNDPGFRRCQLLLEARDHTFLDHDSFLNCYRVYALRDQDDVEGQMAGSTASVMGMCPEETKRKVVDVVSASSDITPVRKAAIAEALLG